MLYFKSRELHFRVAVHESSYRTYTLPLAQCSPACAPHGRLNEEQPAPPAGRPLRRAPYLSPPGQSPRLIVFLVGVAGSGRDGSEPDRSVERLRWAWLSYPLPAVRWPGFRTICLAHRFLAVAWLVRGANASGPESGMPATVSSCPEHEKETVDGGSDDRSGPPQGVAYRGGGRPGRGAARRRAGPGAGGAGRTAAGLGGCLAGADLGSRGRAGLGNLLAQQLLAAGEVVLDVQPKVAARVRLLASGNTSKNDPNDARPVAVAALRSPARRRVAAEDHPAVLKLWTRALPGPGPGPGPGRLPAPRRARRPGPRRLQPGDHRRPGRQHAQAHQAVRPGRPGPPRARRRLHRSACAAWMPRSAKRGTSSPPRCQHRAPP